MYGKCAFELENSDALCEDPEKNKQNPHNLGTIETCKTIARAKRRKLYHDTTLIQYYSVFISLTVFVHRTYNYHKSHDYILKRQPTC